MGSGLDSGCGAEGERGPAGCAAGSTLVAGGMQASLAVEILPRRRPADGEQVQLVSTWHGQHNHKKDPPLCNC